MLEPVILSVEVYSLAVSFPLPLFKHIHAQNFCFGRQLVCFSDGSYSLSGAPFCPIQFGLTNLEFICNSIFRVEGLMFKFIMRRILSKTMFRLLFQQCYWSMTRYSEDSNKFKFWVLYMQLNADNSNDKLLILSWGISLMLNNYM